MLNWNVGQNQLHSSSCNHAINTMTKNCRLETKSTLFETRSTLKQAELKEAHAARKQKTLYFRHPRCPLRPRRPRDFDPTRLPRRRPGGGQRVGQQAARQGNSESTPPAGQCRRPGALGASAVKPSGLRRLGGRRRRVGRGRRGPRRCLK